MPTTSAFFTSASSFHRRGGRCPILVADLFARLTIVALDASRTQANKSRAVVCTRAKPATSRRSDETGGENDGRGCRTCGQRFQRASGRARVSGSRRYVWRIKVPAARADTFHVSRALAGSAASSSASLHVLDLAAIGLVV